MDVFWLYNAAESCFDSTLVRLLLCVYEDKRVSRNESGSHLQDNWFEKENVIFVWVKMSVYYLALSRNEVGKKENHREWNFNS